MFCSNCGKSLKSELTSCPYCGMPVGESRFDSNRGYTSAQTKLRPGQAVRVNSSYGNHYSTEFNVESDRRNDDLPSDEDSIYRSAGGAGVTGYDENDDREPLFDSEDPWRLSKDESEDEAESSPQQGEKRSFRSIFLRRDREEEAPEPETDEDFEELTEAEKDSIRLKDEPAAPSNVGISEDVRRFMTGLREENERRAQEQERKAAKKKAKKQADEDFSEELDFDAGDEDENSVKPRAKKEKKPKEKKTKPAKEDFDSVDFDEDETDEVPDEAVSDEDAPAEEVPQSKKDKKPARKQIRVAKEFFRHHKPEEDFDDFDPDEDEEDEALDGEYAEEFDDDDMDYELRRSNRLRVLRIALAAASALLLIVLGILIVKNLQKKTAPGAPVEDVSGDLWDYGVALMQQHVSDDYIQDRLAQSNEVLFGSELGQELDDLDKLLPAKNERALNDQLFIDALKSIQRNINERLMYDWKTRHDRSGWGAGVTESQRSNESAAGWADVKSQIETLINAKSKGELDSVKKWNIRFESVEATPTPTVTPKPQNYRQLALKSTGDDVINLQTRLIELGYLNDVADGKFGPNTRTAVQLFQQAVGLEVTGIADEETQRRMFENDAPAYSK